MTPPLLLTSCLEQDFCVEPPKFAVISLSAVASVHCFISCPGKLLPTNSIFNSHRPALRVGMSKAKAGAAASKPTAIKTRRRMGGSPVGDSVPQC